MLSFLLKCCFCLLTFQKLANARLDGAGREALSQCSSYEVYDSCRNASQYLDLKVMYGEGQESFQVTSPQERTTGYPVGSSRDDNIFGESTELTAAVYESDDSYQDYAFADGFEEILNLDHTPDDGGTWFEESLSECLRVLTHESCYDDFLCVYRSTPEGRKVYGIGRKDLAECMCRNLNDLRLETARCINLTIVNDNDNKTITIPEYWSVEPKKSADEQPAGGNNWALGNDESTERHDTSGTSIKKGIVSYILMLYLVAILFCP